MSSAADEIIEFQILVAQGWIDDAATIEDRPQFQFVGYFAALNALYWLWGMLDGCEKFSPVERDRVTAALERIPEGDLSQDLRSRMFGGLGGLRNETALLHHLVQKLDPTVARHVLRAHRDYIDFLLVERRRPIHRMDGRSRTESVGDPTEGKKYLRWLGDENADDAKKLKALAGILYLIRCNLVHGSKVAQVEDRGLLGRSVSPLRSITEAALEYTRRFRPGP